MQYMAHFKEDGGWYMYITAHWWTTPISPRHCYTQHSSPHKAQVHAYRLTYTSQHKTLLTQNTETTAHMHTSQRTHAPEAQLPICTPPRRCTKATSKKYIDPQAHLSSRHPFQKPQAHLNTSISFHTPPSHVLLYLTWSMYMSIHTGREGVQKLRTHTYTQISLSYPPCSETHACLCACGVSPICTLYEQRTCTVEHGNKYESNKMYQIRVVCTHKYIASKV